MATTPSHQDFSSRARKNAREKARRQVLNQHYTTLLSFLDLDRSRRMEQTSILRETIAHLNRLMQSHILLVQQNRALHMELNSLKAAAGTPRSEPLTYRERDREEGKLEGSVPPNVSVVAGVNWRRAQRDARVKVVKGVLEAEAHLMAPSNPSTPPTSSSSLNINIPSPLASPAPYGLHVARVSPMSEGTFSNNRVSPKNMVQDRGRLSVTDTRPRSRSTPSSSRATPAGSGRSRSGFRRQPVFFGLDAPPMVTKSNPELGSALKSENKMDTMSEHPMSRSNPELGTDLMLQMFEAAPLTTPESKTLPPLTNMCSNGSDMSPVSLELDIFAEANLMRPIGLFTPDGGEVPPGESSGTFLENSQ